MYLKKIIIIGATSGIGKEMALMYAREKHTVGITGRRGQLLNEIKNQHPEHIITSQFDVTSNDNVVHLTNLIQQMGGLDILIFNAGIGETSNTLNQHIEMQTTATNVVAFVQMVSFAYNYFETKGTGHIAVTSSVAGLRGNSWAPAYSASKAFISTYAEGLNIKAEKDKLDIIISDIRPGFINTKEAKGNKRFWVAAPQKAAKQMINSIEKKKRVAYITKRWWLIGNLMRLLPYNVYKKLA